MLIGSEVTLAQILCSLSLSISPPNTRLQWNIPENNDNDAQKLFAALISTSTIYVFPFTWLLDHMLWYFALIRFGLEAGFQHRRKTIHDLCAQNESFFPERLSFVALPEQQWGVPGAGLMFQWAFKMLWYFQVKEVNAAWVLKTNTWGWH